MRRLHRFTPSDSHGKERSVRGAFDDAGRALQITSSAPRVDAAGGTRDRGGGGLRDAQDTIGFLVPRTMDIRRVRRLGWQERLRRSTTVMEVMGSMLK
ncbi:unnamed protein product [Diplocarpon coronariae]|nr:hypothetical protein JHW43_003613 [Diplocarpon mali]